jgi:hypothetical protein
MPLILMPWRVIQYSSAARHLRAGHRLHLHADRDGAVAGPPWHCTQFARKHAACRTRCGESSEAGTVTSRAPAHRCVHRGLKHGHPEAYIIFLPAAAAMISMIVPAVARTPLLGYRAVVVALIGVGFFCFALWVHHMFTAGLGLLSLAIGWVQRVLPGRAALSTAVALAMAASSAALAAMLVGHAGLRPSVAWTTVPLWVLALPACRSGP